MTKTNVALAISPQEFLRELQAIDGLIAHKRFAEAKDACARLVAMESSDASVLHKIGIALIRIGEHQEAIRMLGQAAQRAPDDPRIRNDLGIAQEKAKDFDAAEQSYREALGLAPNLAEAHSNLADLLVKTEKIDQAVHHARIATKLSPANPLTWLALGDALKTLGKNDEAIAALKKATKLPPPQAKAFAALARVYLERGNKKKAVAVLRESRIVAGDDPKCLNDLGLVLGSMGRYEEAQPLFEFAYARLHEPTTLSNILTNLSHMKRVEDGLALADEVMKHPQPNVAISTLLHLASGTCEWNLRERLLPGFLEWCEKSTRDIVAVDRNLLLLLGVPGFPPQALRGVVEKLAARVRRAVVHQQFDVDHAKAMTNRSKLRVGYLSGDLRSHVVNFVLSGLLSNYDKQYFETYCYSNLDKEEEDGITDQYRGAVDKFVRVSKMDDIQLARRIQDDGVHILIDLSGHTAKSRVGVVFRRPAPVQMSFFGYPFTTGIGEIDYTMYDHWIATPENAKHFSEKMLDMGPCGTSISGFPTVRENPEPPFRRNGCVTFGSLNAVHKLNASVVAAWSRILAQVPGSRMILNHPNYDSPLTKKNIYREFEKHGIDSSRVIIVTGRHPKGSHLFWYEDLDIVLDCFPFTGSTTTFESLWMSIPVVTRVGQAVYERGSYSYLKNCGTPADDLIGFSDEEFVDRAVALARNKDRLAELHGSLHRNLRQSLLCDPAHHIRFIEEALINGWNLKFPQQPRFTAETFAYSRLRSPAAPWVATPADPENVFHYVVEEQGQWFAPEYGMLRALASHLDGCAVEIGGEPGFFSLELAQSGMKAVSLSTSTVAARLIRAAVERGGLAEKVDVRLESAKNHALDRADLKNVALLRIGHEANEGAAGPVVKNTRFWGTNSPLVLASVHSGDGTDLSTANKLAAMGYRLYRLLPAFGCFVPYADEEGLDPFTLYLLACPPGREAPLIANGLLVPAPAPIPAEEIAKLETSQEIDEWVIDCAGRAHDPRRRMAERLGYHQAALHAQTALVGSSPSSTRLITLARLVAEAGRRAEAVALLNGALKEFENGTATFTVPFLAPSITWDAIPPGDRMGEWLLASLLETRCRLAAHSSYFMSESDLASLDAIASTGFSTEFLAGMHRARAARQESGRPA